MTNFEHHNCCRAQTEGRDRQNFSWIGPIGVALGLWVALSLFTTTYGCQLKLSNFATLGMGSGQVYVLTTPAWLRGSDPSWDFKMYPSRNSDASVISSLFARPHIFMHFEDEPTLGNDFYVPMWTLPLGLTILSAIIVLCLGLQVSSDLSPKPK